MAKRLRLDYDHDGSRLSTSKRIRTNARKLSPLESLPTELLQQILIYSLNADLPLASRQIGRCLNSGSLMMEHSYQAFKQIADESSQLPSDTFQETSGFEFLLQSMTTEPASLEREPPHPDVTFLAAVQRRLVRSRFFTWRFCTELGYKLVAFARNPRLAPRLDQDLRSRLRQYSDGLTDMRKARFLNSGMTCESEMRRTIAESSSRSIFRYLWRIAQRGAHDKVNGIPPRLLEGPWSASQLKLLDLFVYRGSGDGHQPEPQENVSSVVSLIAQGYMNAVQSEQMKALVLLEIILEQQTNPGDHVPWLAPVFTEAIFNHTDRLDIHLHLIHVFQTHHQPNRIKLRSAEDLIERPVWYWIDANHLSIPAAKLLKQWTDESVWGNPSVHSIYERYFTETRGCQSFFLSERSRMRRNVYS